MSPVGVEGDSQAEPASVVSDDAAVRPSTETTVDGNYLELQREQAYPHYLPAEGTGSNIGVPGTAANTAPSSRRVSPSNTGTHPSSRPSYFPPFTPADTADKHHSDHNDQQAVQRQSNVNGNATLPTPALTTPSTIPFDYSPPITTPSSVDSASAPSAISVQTSTTGAYSKDHAHSHSPDWLPSPVAEEDENKASPIAPLDKQNGALARSIDQMSLEGLDGITIVPSSKPAATEASPITRGRPEEPVKPKTASTAPQTTTTKPSPSPASAPATATTSKPSQLPPPSAATRPATSPNRPSSLSPSTHVNHAHDFAHTPSSTASRPPVEQKKSMFGKLFHHKDKDHSSQSSVAPSPVPTTTPTDNHAQSTTQKAGGISSRRGSTSSKGRDRGLSTSAYTSGAESDTGSGHAPSINRSTSAAGSTTSTSGGGNAFGNFLARRTSNKKLEKPDATLVAMANKNAINKSNSALDTAHSPNASSSTLLPPGTSTSNLPSSTAASRGSTPDSSVIHVSTPGGTSTPAGRGTTVSPARGHEPKTMMRRASGSAHDGKHTNGTHTPHLGEGVPVKEKSLKEHLAQIGSSAGIGKMTRKGSQTSRRSDDGRSERSVGGHHDDDVVVVGGGGGHAPKRTPSVGAASNASTSLLKKYGVCEKVAIGKGATAIVRLAHKWDRSTEKLYAVKEFRKRRKNETEKEYVKKLTSEFCISSTLHHINVVETVDLVQNEEKHWCEVMEYCPGGDLYAAIKKGDMSNELMNIYFKQIVTGVAYLHSMGVAHRDIKPENLLLDGRGHVKITDFGVSDVFRMCWEKQTHMSKGLCGSEPYIAPEQFEQKEYDARLVDVWACAVVFYCMQAQELPWRVAKHSDPSFQTYLQSYSASSSPAPLGNLHPKECRAIIKKMLDPNPKTRLTMDQVLLDPFMKEIDYTPEPVGPNHGT